MENLKKAVISTSSIDKVSIDNVYEVSENSWNWMFKSLNNQEEKIPTIDLFNKKEIMYFRTEEQAMLKPDEVLNMLKATINCKHKNGKFATYVVESCLKTEYETEGKNIFIVKALSNLDKDTGEYTLIKTYFDIDDIIRINCSDFAKYAFKEEK